MLTKLIPIVFLCLGVGAGVGAGIFLKPSAEDSESGHDEMTSDEAKPAKHDGHSDESGSEFIKLHSQFVVPIIRHDEVSALVVMSLSIEAQPGLSDLFYAREPKLRDLFLQVLFDHANMGGFDGSFTSASALDPLRTALREVAQNELGDDVMNVLITNLARQDN